MFAESRTFLEPQSRLVEQRHHATDVRDRTPDNNYKVVPFIFRHVVLRTIRNRASSLGPGERDRPELPRLSPPSLLESYAPLGL